MLVNDGGGGGNPYQIKINSVSNGGEEDSMGYQEIMEQLHGLKPGDMTAAAASFKKLGETLDRVTAKLASTGNQLAGEWSGEAASKAMSKFQELHDQAAQLAAQAHTTSNTMNWMGTDVMPKFQSIPSPSVMGKSESDAAMGAVAGPGGSLVGAGLGAMGIGPDGQAKADKAAREYMKSFNGYMTQANSQLPASTAGPSSQANPGQWTTPGSTSGSTTGSPGTGSSYTGVGGTNGTGGTAPSSYTPPAGTGHANLAHLSGGSKGAFNGATATPSGHASNAPALTKTGSLQGYSAPPSGSGGGSPFANPGSAGSGGPNPLSRMTMMPSPGAGSSSTSGEETGPGEDGMAGEKGLGEDALKAGKSGLPGEEGEGLSSEGTVGAAEGGSATSAEGAAGADGVAGEAAGTDAAGAAGAGAGEAGGAGAMPMAGGAGGQSDKERQRQAWMNEDEEIWGVPGEDIGPVIG